MPNHALQPLFLRRARTILCCVTLSKCLSIPMIPVLQCVDVKAAALVTASLHANMRRAWMISPFMPLFTNKIKNTETNTFFLV